MATPTLDGFVTHLRLVTGKADDDQLADHLAAARLMVEKRVGPLEPVARTEKVLAGGGALRLSATPVVSVTSVTAVGSATAQTTDLDLDEPSGVVRGVTASGRVAVVYTVGYDPCPDDLELAVYVVGEHLWQTQRGVKSRPGLAGAGQDAVMGAESSALVLRGFALPRRAAEIMSTYEPVGSA